VGHLEVRSTLHVLTLSLEQPLLSGFRLLGANSLDLIQCLSTRAVNFLIFVACHLKLKRRFHC
jgi:hypothetical protein